MYLTINETKQIFLIRCSKINIHIAHALNSHANNSKKNIYYFYNVLKKKKKCISLFCILFTAKIR